MRISNFSSMCHIFLISLGRLRQFHLSNEPSQIYINASQTYSSVVNYTHECILRVKALFNWLALTELLCCLCIVYTRKSAQEKQISCTNYVHWYKWEPWIWKTLSWGRRRSNCWKAWEMGSQSRFHSLLSWLLRRIWKHLEVSLPGLQKRRR